MQKNDLNIPRNNNQDTVEKDIFRFKINYFLLSLSLNNNLSHLNSFR
jgi:hypothetical protein